MSPDSGQDGDAGFRSQFQAELENLAANESGLGFIYSALALVARAYQLDDVVLVVESDGGRTRPQIFRLDGKVIDTEFVVRFGGMPGLYCRPHSVSLDDRLALTDACARALSLHQNRVVTVTEVDDGSLAEELNNSDQDPPVARFDVADDDSGTDHQEVSDDYRVILSRVLVLVDLANLVMTLGGMHGDLRFTLGLVLGLFIPGWSVVGFLKLRNFSLEFALSMASSLALILVAAQVMTQINYWHLGAFEDALCCACLIPLIRLSQNRPQRDVRRS